MLRAGLYARVSTIDQQTLPMQNRAMREYAVTARLDDRPASPRGWTPVRRSEKLARNCWRPPAAGRSMWCWSGDWTAGAGQ